MTVNSFYQEFFSYFVSLDLSLSDSFVHFEGTSNTNRQCLSLNITNDKDVEGNEEVALMLEVVNTTEPFYMAMNQSSMIVEIIDDDSELLAFLMFYTCTYSISGATLEQNEQTTVE